MSEDLKFENVADMLLQLSLTAKVIVDSLHLDFSIERFERWRRVIIALKLIRKGEEKAALHEVAPALTIFYPVRGDRVEVRVGHYTIAQGSSITPEAIIEGIKNNEHILLALIYEDLEVFLKELQKYLVKIKMLEFDLQRLKDSFIAQVSRTETQQQQDP